MNRFLGIALWLLVLLFASIDAATAASVTVSPTMPSVAVGNGVQFTAQVSGLSPTGVVWYAGGVKGGNANAGKISTGGVYTAPGNPAAGWGPWSSVAQGSTAPGAPVTASVWPPVTMSSFFFS